MIGLWGEGGYVMKKRAYRYLCGAAVLILVLLVIRTMNTPGTVPEDYIAPVYASVWSLLPPVIAIVLALITKEVYSSLFIGVLVGALLYANGNLELALNTLMFHPDGGFVVNLTDLSHASILVFVTILGGLVVLMNKSGGAQAFGDWASRRIKSRVGAQLATILMGLLIFVDDGFNCMTVGSVMRPITDGHNVSRAKLAYILDSTAAPVCIIAPISCWAAAVSYAVPESMNINGFNMFIRTIPYNMYALTTLLMMVLLAVFELDYGPMKLHEYNAVKKGDLFTTGDRPYSESQYEAKAARSKVSNLVIPVVLLIVTSIIGMIYTGGFFQGASLIEAFSNADSARALVLGSLITLIVTFFLYTWRGIMDLDGFMGCLPAGFRSMCAPMIILILSWNLSGMTGLLGAGNYVHDVINASASSFLDPDPDRLHGIPAGRSRRDAGHQYFGMPRRRSMRRPLFADLGYNDHVLGRCRVQPHQPCQHSAALCDHIRGCFGSRIPRRRHPGLHHKRTGSHDRDAGHTGPYDPCDPCDQKERSGGYQQDESVTAH